MSFEFNDYPVRLSCLDEMDSSTDVDYFARNFRLKISATSRLHKSCLKMKGKYWDFVYLVDDSFSAFIFVI